MQNTFWYGCNSVCHILCWYWRSEQYLAIIIGVINVYGIINNKYLYLTIISAPLDMIKYILVLDDWIGSDIYQFAALVTTY